MLIDSHCHLDRIDPEAHGDIQTLLQRAQEQNVQHCLCVCIDLEHFPDILALTKRFTSIDCSVGVHPCETSGQDPSVTALLALAEHERVVAIGETGLDYFRLSKDDLDWQRARFRRHIQAAKACAKPLIIHTRNAKDDTLAILREERAETVGGVMHCFAEDWPTAKAAIDLGFLISFSGIITFKNAESLRDVARRVPDEALLVETDSPYLAPMPYRGKSNQPAYVREVAEKLAEVRGTSLAHIAAVTTANYQRLFKRA